MMIFSFETEKKFFKPLEEDNHVVVLGRLKEQIVLVNTKKSNSVELEDR